MTTSLENAMYSLNLTPEENPSNNPFDQPNPFADAEENDEEEDNKLPDPVPKHLQWVFDKKEEILALHSSPTQTRVFNTECGRCDQWFKPCMFSHSERKSGDHICRWCQTELLITTANDFSIHHHIHCNRPGPRICRLSCSMTPPVLAPVTRAPASATRTSAPVSRAPVVVKKEVTMKEVAPAPVPEVGVVFKKKMSQKERKAAARSAANL